MANSELKAKLVIEAESEGSDAIIRLRREMDNLGQSAGLAGPEFEALSAEMDKLGRQQAAIGQFERLKQLTGETTQRAQELQAATREAALALKEQQAAQSAAIAAHQASSAQLDQARERQEALRATISELERELKSLASAAKASGDSSAMMAERLADGRAQLAVLKNESQAAAANITALAVANRETAKAVTEANRETGAAQKHFDGLRKSTKETQIALDAQNVSLQRARDELSKLGISSTSLAQSQVALNRGLDASRESLQRMAQEAEAAAAVLADRELLGVRAHADIQKEIDATRAAYDRLKASGKLTSTELAQAALKTEERVRQLQHQTNGWVDSLGKAKVAFGAMAASGAGLAAVVNKAMQFESAMADVAKVVDGTSGQMAALNGRIKEMTATIPLAATELAQIAAAGGQLGIPIEKLDQFIELAAQMATAFNMSAEQAGNAVAKLSNIFNIPLEDVRKLGDAINTLGNTTAAQEGAIVEVLTRIGGTATQFGLTAQQAAALATAMLSLGVSAEVAGTGINAILSKLQTANIQGKDFQAALTEMGVSAATLAQDIRAHPQKALDDFLATLAQIEKGKQAEILARLFGVEYQDDVARLLTGLDGYKKALASVGDQAATAGAMQKEFETRVQTSEAQIKLLKNGVETLATNLGTALLPALKVVVGGLADASHAVAELAARFPTLASAATLLATVAASTAALRTAFLALRVAGTKTIAGLEGLAAAAGLTATGNTALTKSATGAASATDRLGQSAAAARDRLNGLSLAGKAFLGLAAADGVLQIYELGKAIVQLAQARKHLSQAQETGVKLDAEMAQRLREISEATGVAVTSFEEVMDAQKRGLLVQDEATGKWLSAAQAQDKLATAVTKTTQELAAQDAALLVANFEKMATGAEGAKAALEKLAESLNFGDVRGVSAYVQALHELAAKGQLTAKQVGDAWQQALGKLSTGEIGALRVNLEEAARQGIISAQQLAQANEQILAASFEKLGVNAAQALGKVSTGAQEAINSIDLVAESTQAAGVGAQEAARAIEMAFMAAIPKADSLQAIDAMQKQLKALGDAGKISAEGVERTQAALDKQRAVIEGQIPGIQSLTEALQQLGVKPQKELEELAASAKKAFEFVKASGTATPREINEAWQAMAEAAIAANNGVADASLKAQAQQHGMVIETDKAGKSIVKSMQDAEAATKGVGDAAKDSAKSMEELAQAGLEMGRDMVEQARAHNAALNNVEATWMDAEAAASQYAQQMAAVVWSANKSVAAMAEEHAYLVKMMEALAEQQRQAEDQGNGAARGVEDLRMRLLELSGTEEQIARARHEREELEVQRKMKLTELDLQRAQLNGKQEEAERLQQELRLLAEQLELLDKIHAAEEKQRKARERGGSGGGGSGGGGGGSSGGGVSAPAPPAPQPVNIVLNASGINDPVALARMIEPELRKMARLAR